MRKRYSKVIQKIYLILVFSFMYVPIAVMAVFSFNESKSRTVFTGFTFDWYKNLFRNEMILKSLAISVIVAFISAIIATVIGTMAAIGINNMKRSTRSLVLNISYVPVINPEIITGVSLMLLFVVYKDFANEFLTKLNGSNDVALKVFGFSTLLIAHITFNLPYVIFNVMPKLRQMDIRMYEAALDLGCDPLRAFFKVVLPEIMPAVMSGFLICLTYSIDDFIISYFTCGTLQTLPIAIYSMTRKKVSPEINALSTIMFIVILAIILFMNAADNRREKLGKQKYKN